MKILRSILPLLFTLSTATAEPVTVQKEATQYATRLPAGGIIIYQTQKGASQLGRAGTISADHPTPPALDSVFEIGSITKVFTGVLLVESIRAKKVTLEDTVAQHLPETVKLGPKNPLRHITLLQLATHTTALPRIPDDLYTTPNIDPNNPYAHYDAQALYSFLQTFDDADGLETGHIAYSNFGVGLLGHLLACAWERPYPDLLKERIFDPLGMTQTTVLNQLDTVPPAIRKKMVPPHINSVVSDHWEFDALAGAGAILSSAADLIRFAEAHWDPDAPAGLKSSLLYCLKPQAKDGPSEIGLGWFMMGNEGKRIYLHDGATGGFQSVLRIRPDTQFARIELVNQSITFKDEAQTTEVKGEVSPLAGVWKGELEIPKSNNLRIELHITSHDDDTPLTVEMFSPDQHPNPIHVDRIKLEGNAFSFQVGAVMGAYSGTLNEDKTAITGNWVQSWSNLRLTLKRE